MQKNKNSGSFYCIKWFTLPPEGRKVTLHPEGRKVTLHPEGRKVTLPPSNKGEQEIFRDDKENNCIQNGTKRILHKLKMCAIFYKLIGTFLCHFLFLYLHI